MRQKKILQVGGESKKKSNFAPKHAFQDVGDKSASPEINYQNMKRRILLAATMLLAMTTTALAQSASYITFTETVLPQGGTGEMEVYYEVDANSTFKAFQINVPLPDGITIENVEMAQPLPLTGIEKGTYTALEGMTSDQAKSKFFATANNKSGQSVVIGFQTGNATFPTGKNLLCTLTLKAAETTATNYEGYAPTTSRIELTNTSTEVLESQEQTLNIKVMKLGDVNGDGNVDIADAVCVINNIHEKTNDVFYKSLANVNQDDGIDIADAVSIINILHQPSSSQQAPKHKEIMLDPQ